MHETEIGYDFGLGVPLTVTDPNENMTTSTYDDLGRIKSVKYPGYAQANVKYTYPNVSGGAVSAPFAIKMEVWDEDAAPNQYRLAWQIMDGLGRVIQTQSPYEDTGKLVVTDTSYNAFGLLWRNSNPRTVIQPGGSHYPPTATWADWSGIAYSTSEYDSLQRLDYVYSPDGTLDDFSYSGLETTAIDRNSHKKVQINDAFGRLIEVKEYTGSGTYTEHANTIYEYNQRDQLTEVKDDALNVTTIGYNGFGRKTSMSDPDMGAWSYGYDVLGNLTTQTDARTCVTTIAYDDLNRPLLKTYTGPGACNGTPDVTYTYDSTTGGNEGKGRRTGMSNSDASSTWVYNALGQVSSQTHNIGANYTISGTYDAFSRPLTQTIPSNGSTETLTYNYNAMGALLSLTGTNTYVSQINYSASGQVEDRLLGNGLKQQSCYNATTLRLSSIRVYPGTLESCVVTNPANSRLNLSYQYQNNGNISQIVDATRSETLTYTYDELDRLDTVSGPYSLNHDYNPIGNITAKGTATYTYNASHKHAVASLSTGETYTYDANGNMITRVEGGLTYTQTFDAENRLKSVAVSGQTTQFIYDGDGNLVKKVKPDNSKTIYVLGIYEVDKTSGGTVTQTRTYYPAAGAMRIGSTLYYILKDHLGSASVITNASGVTVSGGEQRYYPYGEGRLTATMITDKLFTGQREMAGLGIYHYGARFYSPKLGRFLSPDTIIPGAANPQAYNRYSYVTNNPLRYTDPTGHMQVADGPQQDRFKPSVYNAYVPKPKPPKDDQEADGDEGGRDDDSLLDPNPNNITLTPTTTPTTTPTWGQNFANTVYSVAQFGFGAALVVGGLGFTALGAGLIVFAVIETTAAIALPTPISPLELFHAGATVAGGVAFIGIGLFSIRAGGILINDALTP